MSWEVLKSGIDRLLESEVDERRLALTGGEPLLAWPLLRRGVEYARGAILGGDDLRISVATNGLLLDREKARFLVFHDVGVQISLDGIREAQELRAPGTFERLDRLLVRLRMDHPSWFRRRFSVGMTLTSVNLPFLSQSVGYLVEHGIDSIRLAPLLTHDEGWGREADAELERQMDEVFQLSLEYHHRTGAIPLELFRRPATPPEARPDRPVCRVNVFETQAIGIDGSVGRCSLLLAQEAGGTLAGPSLREWIRQPEWPGLRRERSSGWRRCSECEFVDECLVCPVASANIPGTADSLRVPAPNCALNRISGRYRRRFPPLESTEAFLRAEDHLPKKMRQLGRVLGLDFGSAPSHQ